ncbi:MAG: hypothetical protein WBQ76_09925 [Candidatus Korobacteraceae bacterium]
MHDTDTRANEIRSNAAAERNLITRLDASLKEQRTPYLKARLRLALNSVNDVDMLLRFEEQAQSLHPGAWLAIAEGNIATAANTRQQIQSLVDTYGGPDNVVEK